jgi:hypothetical protein
MNKRRLFGFLCALCFVAGAALFQPPPDAEAQGRRSSRQRINGTIVGIGGRFSGRTRPFSLIIENYTPTNQVRELNDALSRDGQEGLLRALSKMDAGQIQIGTGVGVTANAVIADPWNEGGTRLTVFYERNISFFELRYGTRSQDYPVGYAEIFLDRNGKGAGTLIPAARVRLKGGNTWEVEDFGVYPARLMGLRASGNIIER